MDNANGKAMLLFFGIFAVCAGVAAVLHVDVSVVFNFVGKVLSGAK